MTKYLEIISEFPCSNTGQQTDYVRLDDNEDAESQLDIAEDAFHDVCSFGFEVVDESDVPEDERT